MPKKLVLWAAILWTLAIAILCLVNFNTLPDIKIGIEGSDKYVHGALHFIFTMLWFLYLSDGNPKSGKASNLLKVLAASLVYGVAIEFIQGAFTVSRQADIKDVAANFTGALIAAVILVLLANYSRSKSN